MATDMVVPDTGNSSRVVAVIVTFHPGREELCELVSVLARQVHRIVLVDNTPADGSVGNLCEWFEPETLVVVALKQNTGIAHALNVGIEHANRLEATHVLLSDQDSLPASDMVAALLRTEFKLVNRGVRVGAVAPLYTDKNTGITYPFQAGVPGKIFYGHVMPDDACPVVEALSLITSGTLIPINVIGDVGLMREDFFIDHVDIEWCLRARGRGWKIFGTSNAVMHHRMGEGALRVWYFGWRQESAYSSLRMYYRIRNFVVLCRTIEVDWRWKVRNAWYWTGFVYGHVIFGPDRLGSLGMALRGILDGMRGRMGEIRMDN